ncbi:hypothetical protein SAMD00023353_2301400 [Rosellinia necatrix]|uniref:Uncharacterized protein n=1 Tax=Rosellinia necatrix TaxID=77044 RepID=A0A1S8A7V7_ROSNE|nr:hypothetical protein SAMD00023353_2301400 [Rosellinia necatrix]
MLYSIILHYSTYLLDVADTPSSPNLISKIVFLCQIWPLNYCFLPTLLRASLAGAPI